MARLRDDLKVMRTEVLKTGDSKLNIPVNVSLGGLGFWGWGSGVGVGVGVVGNALSCVLGFVTLTLHHTFINQPQPPPLCVLSSHPPHPTPRPQNKQMDRLVWIAQTKFDCGPSKVPKPGALGPLDIVKSVKELSEKLVSVKLMVGVA